MKKIPFLLFSLFLTGFAFGQISTPPGGQNNKSIVTQYIGSIAHVSITYNSPDVTGPNGESREGQIWGQLVPYGFTDLGFGLRNPSPWRAGANENTVIEFSHDMMVQGQPIKAGKYGLHVSVEETGPWTIIFSNNSTAWGSYFYVEAEDELRVQADPESTEFREWLTFEFVDRQPSSAICALMWENIKLPFKLEVANSNEVYFTQIRKELQSSPGFTWQSWNQAANLTVQLNENLDQGLEWAETSINAPFTGQENFTTLSTKSRVLNALGRSEESLATMDKAIHHNTANAGQIHNFGRTLIGLGAKAKALEVFQYNHERFEGNWPTEVGMMRGYSAVGEFGKALDHAKLAHAHAPDKLNKDNLASLIEKLKNKQDIN